MPATRSAPITLAFIIAAAATAHAAVQTVANREGVGDGVGDGPVQLGTLNCTALFEAAEKGAMSCSFEATGNDRSEYYAGLLDAGSSLNSESRSTTFSVWSLSSDLAPGGLEGSYGISLGRANVLTSRDFFLASDNPDQGISIDISGMTLTRGDNRG